MKRLFGNFDLLVIAAAFILSLLGERLASELLAALLIGWIGHGIYESVVEIRRLQHLLRAERKP